MAVQVTDVSILVTSSVGRGRRSARTRCRFVSATRAVFLHDIYIHPSLPASRVRMPEGKQVEWRLPPPVANADPGSIFLDKRPVTRRTPIPLAHPTLDDAKLRGAVPHGQEPWEPKNVPTVRFPDTIKAFAHGGTFPSSPERWDVHQQTHVGGNSGTVAAGVRTQTGPSSSAPWVVQTGKPPGGWSVAGSMAEGW